MGAYVFPIKVAFITFPIFAFLITIPFLIYQYRKYGYVNKLRAFVLYSFLLYLIVAYYLIILPLPENRDVRSMQSEDVEHYNLRPFRFIEDIKKETKVELNNRQTYKYLFTERAFLQVVFNILLLVPLGVYLRYYFRLSLKKTILISFLVSLFFEITQLTGLYGLYNAPYRLFDVDDLFFNTLGGVIGYFITPMFTFFLPESSKLDENINLQELKVGYVRRFISVLIDFWILGFIPFYKENLIEQLFINFIYFVVIVYITDGKTIGLWLTNIKITGRKDRISFKEVLIRNGMLFIILTGINKGLSDVIVYNETTSIASYLVIVVFFQLFYNIFLASHFVISMINNDRFFYEKMSKTQMKINKE